MRIVLTFLMLFATLFGFSQFENTKKGIRFAATKKKEAPLKELDEKKESPAVIKYESSIGKKEDGLLGYSILPKKVEKGILEEEVSTVRKSSELYTEKLNSKLAQEGISHTIVDSDMFLGEYTVFTKQIAISARDYSAIDGDLVRIWINGQIITKEIDLDSEYQKNTYTLQEGLNIIQIEALNIGLSFPNTGQFSFVDGNGKRITEQFWGLNQGFRAVLKVYKAKGLEEKK
jgi:hypothetical protein